MFTGYLGPFLQVVEINNLHWNLRWWNFHGEIWVILLRIVFLPLIVHNRSYFFLVLGMYKEHSSLLSCRRNLSQTVKKVFNFNHILGHYNEYTYGFSRLLHTGVFEQFSYKYLRNKYYRVFTFVVFVGSWLLADLFSPHRYITLW